MSLKYTIDDLFEDNLPISIDLPELADTPSSVNQFTDGITGQAIKDGQLGGNLQSTNFVTGTTGFKLTPSGADIPTAVLTGTLTQAQLNIANRGWSQTSAFSITDADTVAWGAGTFTSADGTAYSIGAGNTGNMVAKTYIYLDTAVSTTAYQTTTTATTAVGAGKVLIAIAQNGTGEATYKVLEGQGGENIDAANIVAGSITANEIAASTITAGKMSVSQLSAIAADFGTITAGTVRANSIVLAGNIRNIDAHTAGEAINASTTPQAVYKDSSDGKIYKTDADDSTKRKFIGFVDNAQNVATNDSVDVVVEGMVAGFTGLTNGQFIYLTDTAGSISHTPSTTMVIRIGIAVSATEIIIFQKGQKSIFGTASNACNTSDSTVTVTCGFRPRFIVTSAICKSSGSGGCNGGTMICNGGWSDSSGQGWSGTDGTAVITTGNVCQSDNGPDSNRTITIQNITETGFDIFFDNGNPMYTTSGQITYIAIGE